MYTTVRQKVKAAVRLLRAETCVLCVGLMLGIGACAVAPRNGVSTCNPIARVMRVMDSVVLFESADGGFGSGVVIDSNCVLTAKHVLDHVGVGCTFRTYDGLEYVISRTVCDEDSDLAKVYIDSKFECPSATVCAEPLKVLDKIYVLGSPGDVSMYVTVLPGRIVKVDHDHTELISGYAYRNMDTYDAHTTGGCSGGPVVDEKGRVRGIHVLGCRNLSEGVPIEELDI